MNIGFMQGRLVNSEKKNLLQYFPAQQWKKEIILSEKIGFKILEWTINYENINRNHLYNFNKNKDLLKFLSYHSISIPSITCDFFMQKPFFKSKKFQSLLRDLIRVIELSKKVGVKFIILPLVDNSTIDNAEQENTLIKELKKVSKFLNNNQKILFEIDYPPNKIIPFLKKFNNKFGINYDTGNSASLGFDFNEEKKYFKFVHNVHIKDRIFRGQSVRLGKGDFNFKEFFVYLKKIKYKGNLILQTARSKKHINEIILNRNFIKNFI